MALTRLGALGAMLLLSGCAGLATLTAVTTPKDLYELTPKSSYDASLPRIESQLVVDEPTAAAGLNTDRIAVKPNPFAVQYFPNSSWVDRAPLMVQTLLVESFENTGAVRSVGREAIGITADYTLLTDLREFQARLSPGEGEGIVVQVQLNIKVVEEPRGIIIASESFGNTTPAASGEILDVVAAFDEALGKTMRAAVDWAVRRIAEAGDGN